MKEQDEQKEVESMSEVFPKGTKVRVGIEYTQEIATVGKVYTILGHEPGWPISFYTVKDDDEREHRFMDHLLERVEVSVEEKVVEVLKELLDEALVCTRVWSGWSYGTMLEGDFELLAEQDELLSEVAQAVIKAVRN